MRVFQKCGGVANALPLLFSEGANVHHYIFLEGEMSTLLYEVGGKCPHMQFKAGGKCPWGKNHSTLIHDI